MIWMRAKNTKSPMPECRLSFWDALIVTSAVQAKTEILLSEDLSHGQIIEGVQVENPFAKMLGL